MYKKSRAQFMENLKSIRKKIQQKLNEQNKEQQNMSEVKINKKELYIFNQNSYVSQNNPQNVRATSRGSISTRYSPKRRGTLQTSKNQYVYFQQRTPLYRKKIYKLSQSRLINNEQKPRSKLRVRINSMPDQIRSLYRKPSQSIEGNFEDQYLSIPQKRQKRVNEHLYHVFRHLKKYNKLFQKLEQKLAVCLLKIGYYHELNPEDIVYKINYDRSSFYIILSGVIFLMNPYTGYKKLLFTGETFGEEMLLHSLKQKKFLQQAKASTKTYVLEIKVKDYNSLVSQAKRLGYSQDIEVIEQELRDGFTIKNIGRNEHLINRKIKMSR